MPPGFLGTVLGVSRSSVPSQGIYGSIFLPPFRVQERDVLSPGSPENGASAYTRVAGRNGEKISKNSFREVGKHEIVRMKVAFIAIPLGRGKHCNSCEVEIHFDI